MRLAASCPEPFASAVDQLIAELDWLDRRLACHVARLRREKSFNEDPLRGLYVGDGEVDALLSASEDDDPDAVALGLRRAVLDARAEASASLPLARIARAFGLDAVDRAALVIAAAPALERRYATLFAFVQNDVGRRLPTPGLILALLEEDRVARFAGLQRFGAGSPLLAGGLLTVSETEAGRSLADRGLSVDDRVVAALLGDIGFDVRLWDFVEVAERDLAPAPAIAADVRTALADGARCILFEGAADAGQHGAALAACAERRLGLLLVDGDHPNFAGLIPVIDREAKLQEASLLVTVSGRSIERIAPRLAAADRPLFLSAPPGAVDGAVIASAMPLRLIVVPPATLQQRAAWWRAAMPSDASAQRLAQATRLGPLAIGRALAAQPADPAAAARAYAGGKLPGVARLVPPSWTWDDLLVPSRQRDQLRHLAATASHWPRVIGEWGFGATTSWPQRCVALFTGPSGTGKTMAASLIAAEIGVPLYRVDLAAIFDKYVGETEKQLDRLFGAAADAGAALLFDEADVLFGKRTEKRDAHDHFANLSTAFVLQRIEVHDGLVMLTSNLAANMDDAFARRLTAMIAFPMPGAAERRQMWARSFPDAAPRAEDLDLDAIANRIELSGGNIRNAAIAAAYRAAAAGMAIGRSHVLAAITDELEKIGRTPISADFGDL